MGLPVNPDGSLRPFSPGELAAINLRTADVKDGSHPTFRLDSQGCSITRAWFCDWAQRDNAVAALLGGVALAGSAPDYVLSRVMPFTVPGFPQYPAIAIESITGARSAGIDDADSVPAYKSAKIIVRHEQVFFSLAADGIVPEANRYVEQLPSTVDASMLNLPGSGFAYRTASLNSPAGVPIPRNVGKVEPVRKVAYKWHRLPFEAWFPGSPLFTRVHGDPANGVLPFIGTVNSTPFLGYPAGFVLFDGVDEEIVPDPVRGFSCWNLTFHFSVNAKMGTDSNGNGGWNYIYWVSPGTIISAFLSISDGYYFATRGGSWLANGFINDGLCLYNERDHRLLFDVGGS